MVNKAFIQLNTNEWFSFIDEIGTKQNFDELGEIVQNFDKSEYFRQADLSQLHSASFVGQMVKRMTEKAQEMKRESLLVSR